MSAFQYLGAIVEGNGSIMSDVESRIAKASRAFGAPTEQQRTNHISSVQVSEMFGMDESIEDLILRRRLCWLGHMA